MRAVLVIILTISMVAAQSRPTDDARNRAGKLFSEGRFVEVKALAQPYLTDDRANAAWWIISAEAHVELEDFEKACHDFERAHVLDATLDPLMVRYGLALVRCGRTQEARGWLKPFLSHKETDRRSTAMYFIALASLAEDQSVEARAILQRALVLTPDQARLHVRLAQLDLAEGRFAEAVAHASTALRLKPLSVAAAHTKALALTQLNQLKSAEMARAEHRRLLDANDRIATLVSSLGTTLEPAQVCLSISEIAESAGDRVLALTWANRAVSRDPSSARARAHAEALRAESRPTSRKST